VAQAEVLVRATVGTNQSIPNNAYTKVQFDTETLDVYNEFNTSTNTFTAKRAGQYFITATFLFNTAAWATNAQILATIDKNGAQIMQNWYPIQGSYNNYTGVTVNQTIDLAVGDTIHIGVYQSSGAAKTLFASTSYSGMSISRFPSSSELVVKPETQNVFGGVVYTGSTNHTLFGTTAEPTAFSSFNNAGWNQPTMLKGKAAVTTTNSGNDLGFSMPNLPVGTYKVEVSGLIGATQSGDTSANVKTSCNFKIVETTTSTDVAKQSHQDWSTTTSASEETRDWPMSFTGVFSNTSVATRNFRLEAQKYEDSTTGNIGVCQAYTNTIGLQTYITFLITPLDQPSNSALYVEGPVKAAATGAAIPAGYAGQSKTGGGQITRTSGIGNYYDVTGASVSLESGNWFVCHSLYTWSYSTTTANRLDSFLSRMWNATDSAIVGRELYSRGFFPTMQSDSSATFSQCAPLSITATKTIQVQCQFLPQIGGFTFGQYTCDGYISAIRLN